MKIAICDDRIKQIEIIKKATQIYFDKINNAVELNTFDNAFNFLDAHKKNSFDLVLLDICMPGILGTDVAKEIRQRHDKTEIIFLTTSSEFAIQAFAVRAAHYLLKPFTQNDFNEAMDRALHNINDSQSKLLYLKCPKGIMESVEKDSIVYIESSAHKQSIYLNNGKVIETVQTLTELLKLLNEISNGQFIIPYKGYIVNQRAIRTIEIDKIIMKNQKNIPIPKRNFRIIKQDYFDYMFNEGM